MNNYNFKKKEKKKQFENLENGGDKRKKPILEIKE